MIESFHSSSKVWVFMGNEKFNSTQEQVISNEISSFIASWQTHGKDLETSFEIKYNQFIVIAVNESIEKASGCSIDSLTQIIKKLEQATHLTLLNRFLVGFLHDKNDKEISVLPLNEFRQRIKENSLEENSYIFNPSISTVADYTNNWIQPLNESWASRYFSKAGI